MNDWNENYCLNSIFTMIYLKKHFSDTVKNDEQVNLFLRNFLYRRLFREWRRRDLRCRSQIIARSETVIRLLQTCWLTCCWSWVDQISIVRSRWARWHERFNLSSDRWSQIWWLSECRRRLVRFTWDNCCRCSFRNDIEIDTERRFRTVDRRFCTEIYARWVSWYINLDVDDL